MSEWKTVKLGELYSVHNGLSKGGQFFGSGFPFLTFSKVFNNYFIPEKLDDLVQSTEKEQESYSIKRGDVFVTRTSETADELGMSCVALKDYPTATYNGFTKRMRPIKENEVLPEYIGYYMRMPSFRGKFQAFSMMTTRASLKNEALLGLKIALPSMETQKRIASILFALDDKIENNNKINHNLEQMAQAIFKSWFVDFEPFGGVMPCNWREGTLGEIVIPKKGKNITKKDVTLGNIPVVSGGLEPACYHNQANTQYPVITISASGANAGFVRLYYVPVWSADSSYIDASITPFVYFSYAFLKLNQKNIFDKQVGSAQPHIYPYHIASLPLVIPTLVKMEEYEKLVSPFFEEIGKNGLESTYLASLRDSLLPRLMSGELSVDEITL